MPWQQAPTRAPRRFTAVAFRFTGQGRIGRIFVTNTSYI